MSIKAITIIIGLLYPGKIYPLNRIEDSFKSQLNKKFLNYTIPKRFLINLNTFYKLKQYIFDSKFLSFYKKPSLTNAKVNKALNVSKRELNVHMYTNDNFEKRFGMSIYHYIARVKANPESEEAASLKAVINSYKTDGRKTPKIKKFLILNNSVN
jgi:hypothetical protein